MSGTHTHSDIGHRCTNAQMHTDRTTRLNLRALASWVKLTSTAKPNAVWACVTRLTHAGQCSKAKARCKLFISLFIPTVRVLAACDAPPRSCQPPPTRTRADIQLAPSAWGSCRMEQMAGLAHGSYLLRSRHQGQGLCRVHHGLLLAHILLVAMSESRSHYSLIGDKRRKWKLVTSRAIMLINAILRSQHNDD